MSFWHHIDYYPQYQIDSISDPRDSYDGGSHSECQGTLSPSSQRLSKYNFSALAVIWIFGIFALAELQRRRFWHTLSQQIQQRGPDYVERCIIQKETQLGSDHDVTSPALFPPFPELDPDAENTSPSVNEEDIKDVSVHCCIPSGRNKRLCNRSSPCQNEKSSNTRPLVTLSAEAVRGRQQQLYSR